MAAARWALAAVALAAALATGASASASEATAAAEAANEVLRAHQLPGGLLPAGITAFRYDAATGRFEAALDAPCTARFQVGLRYNVSVAGVISPGQIAAISGVSAQDLFMWFPVRDIKVDIPSSGVIYFNVGVVKKHFPLTAFDAPPPCTPDTSPLLVRAVPLLRGDPPQPLEEVDTDGSVASQ
ncbi:hypothetical protein BS78_03G377500 [Paspalum vaginatum]|nr:hypothetical protein BS78_03G377500 [Paspalum vaginatum]